MEGIKDNSGNEQLLSTIQELLSVKNQETHLNFIREHPELLSKEADRLLLELIESQENEDSRRYFEKQRDLLQKFRELGVDSVFPKNPTPQEQNGRPPANLELRNDLQQALHATKQLKNDRSLDAFNKAIQAWEKVISNPEAKNNFELYGAASAQTASLLMTRYKIIRNKKDIDYAITLLKQSINIVSPNSQLKPRIFNTLGNGLRDRYFRTGDIKDFEEAIENFKKAVSLTPQESPELPGYLNNLGNGLRDRYFRTRELKELEEAIEKYNQAVSLTPPEAPSLPGHLTNLGTGLRDRYSRTGDLKDLEEAIEKYKQAVSLTPPESPEMPIYLNNLGNGLSDLYSRSGDLKELEEAIEKYKQAVSLTPPESPELPGRLNNLGVGLKNRYSRTSDFKDLEEAIEKYKQAVSLTPSESPELPGRLNNLGNGLRNRYSHTGDLKDIEEAIEKYKQAVSLTPPESPEMPSILNNLGNGLSDLYSRSGDLKELEEAIEKYKQAVSLTPPESPEMPSILNNLGTGLRDRYSRTWDLKELEEAIEKYKQAVSLTLPESPKLPMYLNNLGAGLSNLYSRTWDLKELEEAIENFKKAVSLTPQESPELPGYLNNLGAGLSDLYSCTGDQELEGAIENFKKAVSLTFPESPELPMYLNNLGNGLSYLYFHTGDLKNLEEAIANYKMAFSLTDPEAPSLPGYLNNLGSGLSNLYSHTGDLKDIKEAFGAYNEARNCMDHSFSKIMVAYKLGLRDTLGKIDVNIVKISLKLKEACSPAEISKWVIESMVSVEGAKSRLLNEFIAKGDIPAPSSISPALAEEEAQIVKKLVDIDNMELSSRGLLGASEEETSSRMLRIKERDEFIQRLNNLWSQMETFGEEAANFVNLRRGTRPSWEDLRILTKEAGSDSAVLSLFILDEQLILFVLKEDWEYPEIIEASLTYNILQKKEGKSFSEVMEDLKIIVGPLLESIRPYLNGVKRVIISPYGFGHFIPWAALAKESNLEVSWVVVPALGSLSGILKRSTKGVDRSLVIGNPIEDLDHSEEEAKIIADRLNSKPVLRKRATKEIAMDLLPEVRIAHFSTHGYFAPSDPLDSGIVLANGVLTAREVMGLGARPELLVLSACETGVTGNMGGDEMMGLSQAFLQAGARSLLVSLWKVDDESTAFLMENFYDFWLKGDNKAEALSKAMDETRKLWSDIYYWGAFNLVGDWR